MTRMTHRFIITLAALAIPYAALARVPATAQQPPPASAQPPAAQTPPAQPTTQPPPAQTPTPPPAVQPPATPPSSPASPQMPAAQTPAQTPDAAPSTMDAQGAAALLDRMETVLSASLGNKPPSGNQAKATGTSGVMPGVDAKSPAGRVSVDRAALDELLAEVQQLRAMLRVK